ncbi:hypothetical protein CIB95_00210 [Lottiidibacillus patelloidae]|uniref:LTD domain-containing protein n=1 Tax=Lottiidibacillus patelloidae TaxID=2670334 RepID=A0A263BWT7_9BACI|nr:lamin tail domain-containing protein [Lottiidibacillus patelloidae]OZM58038.1 hypothetical protein CIB95_00210 [Lottiidibacillus patelloidae]
MKTSKVLFSLITILILLTNGIIQSQHEINRGYASSPLSVVINEIAWMGTSLNYNSEWIELYNNSATEIILDGWVLIAGDGSPEIVLQGSIAANGYFLLERTDDSSTNITADQVYTGSLENSGETLTLYDSTNIQTRNLIDQVDMWHAGNNTTKSTMERTDGTIEGNVPTNWNDSISLYTGGYGTPRALNSKSNNPNRKVKATPLELTEHTLDGNVISLNLQNDTYSTNVASSITLNNPPPGTLIGSVERYNDYSVHVTLQYDGTNFDVDITNFSFTVLDNGLVGTGNLTSNSITVKAMNTVEGTQGYTATGDSYPTLIEMTGYNIREKRLYINSALHTEKDVTNKTATFYYFIKVYDEFSNVIGNLGDISNPIAVTGNLGSSDVDIKNINLLLTQDLPAAYRIVIVIKSVSIN